MFVTRITGPDDKLKKTTHNPTWNEVENALKALDSHSKSLLILETDDPDRYMSVGGGAGRYLCYITPDNCEFENMVNPSGASGNSAKIVLGGQEGEYLESEFVDLPTILNVAKTYFESGERSREVRWENQE